MTSGSTTGTPDYEYVPRDHDLDRLDALLTAYRTREPDRRGMLADQIVDALVLDQLVAELRCLRTRPHGPCPDPGRHTHAAEA